MTWSAPLAAEAAKPFNRPFFVLSIEAGAEILRYITSEAPYAFSGTGDAGLDGFTFEPAPWLALSEVRQGSAGQVEEVTLELAVAGEHRQTLFDLRDEDWFGAVTKLWQGAFDPSTGLSVAAPHPVMMDGVLDRLPYRTGADRATLSAIAKSARWRWERNGASRLSHEQQQLDHAGDIGFSFIADFARREALNAGGGRIDFRGGGGRDGVEVALN